MRALLTRLDYLLSLILGVVLAHTVAWSAQAAGIYWTDSGSASIGHANLDGTGVNREFIYPVFAPSGIAVDEAHLYWTYSGCCSSYDYHYIARANLDGTGETNSFVSSQAYQSSLAVNETHIYWGDNFSSSPGPQPRPTSIGRASLDGTGSTNSFLAGVDPASIAIDGNYIYWSDYDANSIGRANLDGTSVNNSFIIGANHPIGVAVDGGYVYWANNGPSSYTGTIGRANIDGTGVNQSFISTLSYADFIGNPVGVAVDETHLYFTTPQNTSYIFRADLDGNSPAEPFIYAQGYPWMLAVVPIPEPGTGLLVLAGLLGVAGWRKIRA